MTSRRISVFGSWKLYPSSVSIPWKHCSKSVMQPYSQAQGWGFYSHLKLLFALHHLDFLVCFSDLDAKSPMYRCFSSVLKTDLHGSFKETETRILGRRPFLSGLVNSLCVCSIVRKCRNSCKSICMDENIETMRGPWTSSLLVSGGAGIRIMSVWSQSLLFSESQAVWKRKGNNAEQDQG